MFLIREQSLKNEVHVISRDVEMHLLKSGTFNKSDSMFEINEVSLILITMTLFLAFVVKILLMMQFL